MAARRLPASLGMVALLLAVGVAFQGLWRPFEQSPAWDWVAYGLPAFEEGRLWTALTGTFFVDAPWVYVSVLLSFAGMAYLEFRRGWRVALAYYWGGQLFAIFASAAFLYALRSTPWEWAQTEAQVLDVGPSGGTLACIAAALGIVKAPWRVRGWLLLVAYLTVALLFWGTLADLEHLFAVLLVLAVDRSLHIQRTTVREQRFIAFVALIAMGTINLISALVPTDGPLGATGRVSTSIWATSINILVILLIANGLRRGRRWAWISSIVLSSINVGVACLVALVIATDGWEGTSAVLDEAPGIGIATGILWLLMLVYLIAVRGAFHAKRRGVLGPAPAPRREDAVTMLRADGGGTLSWMTTWDGMEYVRTSTGIVAYQHHAGVALALADPLGPEVGRATSVAEFAELAERAALVPCLFSASGDTLQAMPDGWASLVVADDTIVDLPGLEFTGKRWNSVRTSLNRAGREEMTFRMTRLSDEPWGVRQQLRAISEMWVGDKSLPEMGFTLGTLAEADDPDVRLALAVSPRGDIDGFLSWLPVFGEGAPRGWTLDLMRRRDGGFAPVMEFLIASSAAHFRDEGAEFLSLSGAPLTHDYPQGAGAIAALSERLAGALEPLYGFRSLHRFKEKFHPRYEALHLLYRDQVDLPLIGAALTRAFLPNATVRQFAGAGRELVQAARDGAAKDG